ncbi:MAG TPA: methyltransferase domain-containing protein [Longimicrobiaceae bacterium]|nr:methyltransferase domain-containing protein [Longimicrobiaceae bacterium]
MSLQTRARGAELMDEPAADVAELRRTLRDLRVVNRWLGGTHVVLRHLRAMLSRLPLERYRILDVATGSGDIPLSVARWARRRGIAVEILATDAHPRTAALARELTAAEPAIRVEQADALSLPYEDAAFDFALCSTALHHFDGQDALQVLRELDRVAAHGVVVSDLLRSRFGLWGARLLAATLWRRSELTRHDGPLSVRRAFTAAELRGLARAAGLRNARVHTHHLFRLSLVVDRTISGERE